MSDNKKKKKSYVVRFWYTWHTDVEVEAEDIEEAQEQAYEMPDEKIFDGYDRGDIDLEYDDIEIFGGEK